jgi:hypothetical protein
MDKRGFIPDRAVNMSIGPGMYNSPTQILSDKTKIISHNIGQVPFGSQTDGRKTLHRLGTTTNVPGPGSYEHNKIVLTKPMPLKACNNLAV